MATDRELVNFSQEHELNTVLARHGKAQSKAKQIARYFASLAKRAKKN